MSFPTACEAFRAVVQNTAPRGQLDASDVLLEYAEAPNACGPSTSVVLASLRAPEDSGRIGCREKLAFCPPCGWQRLWRISYSSKTILWDRARKICSPPVAKSAASTVIPRSSMETGEVGGLQSLPAAVLARVILCCDLPTLLRLASAISAVGRIDRTTEVGEAMPRPLHGSRPDCWLSFARASLRWADLLGTLESSASFSLQRQKRRKQPQAADSASFKKDSLSFSASSCTASCVVPDLRTLAAALCPDSPKLLATGHAQAIRLWELPGLAKLGMLKTKGPAIGLDMGDAGRLLAACISPMPTAAGNLDHLSVFVWDLTANVFSSGTGTSALWQVPVPAAAPLSFLDSACLLVAAGVDSGGTLNVLDVTRGGTSLKLLGSASDGRPEASCCATVQGAWCEGESEDRSPRLCNIVAIGCQLNAVVGCHGVRHQGDGDYKMVSFSQLPSSDRACHISALSACTAEVAAATSTGRVYVWRLYDRCLIANLDAVPTSDVEGLSWSVSRAEMLLLSSQPADSTHRLRSAEGVCTLLALEEVVVYAFAVGDVGSEGADAGGSIPSACALVAWHTTTGTRLPHPWHQAGPLDALSPFRQLQAAAPVVLPAGKVIGLLAADQSLRWMVASLDDTGVAQPATCLFTRGGSPEPMSARPRYHQSVTSASGYSAVP
eukprot:TRINITY_DN94575_c0_g1_i1.p1 TRINITY_DN94575_c0_g1~~TRINITY_DN94575_c0_g1_i1.p1  ORF type:complete len:676 (+),score=102.64 TRINITY_DN94575_c0_g1_i1:33-2030(+)